MQDEDTGKRAVDCTVTLPPGHAAAGVVCACTVLLRVLGGR